MTIAGPRGLRAAETEGEIRTGNAERQKLARNIHGWYPYKKKVPEAPWDIACSRRVLETVAAQIATAAGRAGPLGKPAQRPRSGLLRQCDHREEGASGVAPLGEPTPPPIFLRSHHHLAGPGRCKSGRGGTVDAEIVVPGQTRRGGDRLIIPPLSTPLMRRRSGRRPSRAPYPSTALSSTEEASHQSIAIGVPA